ncbi:MAG: dioxygenase [Deltaproteobacteria bacterium]|nr:dioxygenase [Deltaproteobacteria bacterium]
MRSSLSRRQFFGLGTSLLVAACGNRALARGPHDAPATAQVDDGDAAPSPVQQASCGGVTADNIEGPFYKRGAPHRAVLAERDMPGEPLVLLGSVRSTGCTPIAGAELDLWHANTAGDYDHAGFGLRGVLETTRDGLWQVRTIVPGRYLNGRRYRPAHIHVKLRAPGHAPLTTQLYFAGDPYNAHDDFIVPSLIMRHTAKDGVRRAMFDFVLAAT